MLIDLIDVAGNIISAVAEIAIGSVGPETDLELKEVLVALGVFVTVGIYAAAFSSKLISVSAFVLPWIVGARLRHVRRIHAHDTSSAFERQRQHFYLAMATTFGAALLLELALAIGHPANGMALSPTLLAQIPNLTITHVAVATAFPAALWALWHTKNRTQAIGGGLLAAGLIAQAFDQVSTGGSIVWQPGWSFTLGLVILGASVLALGTTLEPAPLALSTGPQQARKRSKR